jgi:hypothetical protein
MTFDAKDRKRPFMTGGYSFGKRMISNAKDRKVYDTSLSHSFNGEIMVTMESFSKFISFISTTEYKWSFSFNGEIMVTMESFLMNSMLVTV